MRKKLPAVWSAVLLALALTACSAVTGKVDYTGVTINMETSPEAIENLVLWISSKGEVENHNILQTNTMADSSLLCNVMDCLLTQNTEGQLVPAIAESWEKNADATVWTFHLRNDVSWVDMNGKYRASCTAEDFITGMEWVLNYYKGNAANVQMPVNYILGAEEYLEYTRSLSKEEARGLSRETFLKYVDIEAPDSTTLIYHLTRPCPYFDSITTYSSFYPASQALIDELGVDEFLLSPYYEVWYNGPYLLTEFIAGNEKILDANPLWYGNEKNTRFRSVTIKALEDSSIAYQLYKSGEVDQVKLSQSQLTAILKDPDSPYYRRLTDDYPQTLPYMIGLNFAKKNPDGTEDENWNRAVANEAFRKSLYYGMDLTEFYALSNPIAPLDLEQNIISSAHLASFSDGTDYADAVEANIDLAGKAGQPSRLDPEKAEMYKKQAREELTALGVSFPVVIDYYIQASSQSDIDGAKVLKSAVENSLGKDYVNLEIHTVMNSVMSEAYPQGLQSISHTGWSADFSDPINFLTQYLYSDPSAVYAGKVTHITELAEKKKNGTLEPWRQQLMEEYEEFERLTAAADAIVDDEDARLAAFVQAESYAISHCLAGVGAENRKNWELTNIDNTSYVHSGFGVNAYRYVNLKTNRNGYVPDSSGEYSLPADEEAAG